MMNDLPSRRARQRMDAASDPEPFSLRQYAMSVSPAASLGSHLRFCSSVPPRMIGNEPSALTAKRTPTPPHARASSSTVMQRLRIRSPPAPPYSCGIHTLKMPALASSFWTSHGYSWARSCFAAIGRTTFSAISRTLYFHSRFSLLSNPSTLPPILDSRFSILDFRTRSRNWSRREFRAGHETGLAFKQLVDALVLEEGVQLGIDP